MTEATKSGYKLTNVGWIPYEWKIERFENFASFKNGLNYSKDEKGQGLKIIGVGDFQNHNSITYEQLEQVNLSSSISPDYLLKNNDLLFVRSNGNRDLIGRALLITNIGEAISHSGFTIRARIVKDNFDPKYYGYVFKSKIVKDQFVKLGAGTNISNLSQQILGGLKLPVPPLPEQQKIVAIISNWDEAIQKCEQTVTALQKRNKGLAQQLLTGKTRLKGFSGEWKFYSYDRILKKVKRPVEWSDDELYKLVSVRRRSGGIFYREALYGHQIKVKNLHTAKTGDFLFSKMQIVHGASALVTPEFDGSMISGSYISVRAKDETLLDMEYFNWYSKLPEFYHQTFVSSYGVHIEKMTFDFELFLAEKVKLPEVSEQKAIVKVLEQANQELVLFEQRLTTLRQQKKGMMQKLLTGEVRVKPVAI